MTSASPSEDDNPQDPENPSGRKNKKKRETKRPEGRRSQEAKAIATSKSLVNWPEFTERRARAPNYEDFSVLLFELALEKESDQHLNVYRPGGGSSGSQARGYQ